MFETHEVEDEPSDLTIENLDWRGPAADRPEVPARSRGAEFAVREVLFGAVFEAFDGSGEEISTGWRPTVASAKRAAKRRIRRSNARSRR